MSGNGFSTLKTSISTVGVDESSFNEPISKSGFGVGKHSVEIESITATEGMSGDQLVVTYTDGKASTKNYISFFYTKPGEARKYSASYIKFSHLFSSNLLFRNEFFCKIALEETLKFNYLKGTKMTIHVAPGKKGADIVLDSETSGYTIIDVETKKPIVETQFMSLGEAAQYLKDSGIKRAYNRIEATTVTQEELLENENILRTALNSATAPQVTQTLRTANMF